MSLKYVGRLRHHSGGEAVCFLCKHLSGGRWSVRTFELSFQCLKKKEFWLLSSSLGALHEKQNRSSCGFFLFPLCSFPSAWLIMLYLLRFVLPQTFWNKKNKTCSNSGVLVCLWEGQATSYSRYIVMDLQQKLAATIKLLLGDFKWGCFSFLSL